MSAPTCALAVFPPATPTPAFYFHALQMARDRASVIATIREFLPF